MGFVKESANKTPIVDTVFAIVKMAKDAKEKYGEENVVDATIGSLYDEEGKLVAYKSVFNNFDSIPAEVKAAYASSFTGNPEYRKLCEYWTIKKNNVKLECSTIATPGGTGAVSLTMSEFLEVGETVLIPEIAWGSYALMAQDKQLKVARYEMFDGDAFNLNSVKEQMLALVGKQNRIVLVVNDPCHNPTGYSMTREEWKELIAFVNEVSKTTPVIILNDIAYIDYSYDVDHSRDYMKTFEDINENVMIVIAMSCSKTMTSYGLRCGAAIICAKTKESVREAEIVFEKSARALWSNINNAAMVNFVKTLVRNTEEFTLEKARYIDLLQIRSTIFIEEANECGLPIYPYKEGFFVTIKVNNDIKEKYHEALMKENIFTVQVNKGIRVAICSLPIEKAKGLAKRMKDILDRM
ncbi:MAG: pyridoxal phosphate-dependent aminotransferase [Traorella sp.]